MANGHSRFSREGVKDWAPLNLAALLALRVVTSFGRIVASAILRIPFSSRMHWRSQDLISNNGLSRLVMYKNPMPGISFPLINEPAMFSMQSRLIYSQLWRHDIYFLFSSIHVFGVELNVQTFCRVIHSCELIFLVKLSLWGGNGALIFLFICHDNMRERERNILFIQCFIFWVSRVCLYEECAY